MKAKDLVGKIVLRTGPTCYGDYSYASEPIVIHKVTDSHIYYTQLIGGIFDSNRSSVLDLRWLDDKWTEYDPPEASTQKGKFKFRVTMEVTAPQALALQTMFEYWNTLGNCGASREVGFYCDGDGDFRPNCMFESTVNLPELTDEIRSKAVVRNDDGTKSFDYDGIAWMLREMREAEIGEDKRNVETQPTETENTITSQESIETDCCTPG